VPTPLAFRSTTGSTGHSLGSEIARAPSAGLDEFMNWSATNCKECGDLFGSLIAGVNEAGLLEYTHWEDNVLTADMKNDDVYGEIASSSRVPVAWKLSQQVKFNFGLIEGFPYRVETTGVSTVPSAQALHLYKEAMAYGNLDPAACVDDIECIKLEMDACWAHMEANWKSNLKIKSAAGKISKILGNSYDSFKIYSAIKLSGEWPKTYYALITAAPLLIDSFTLSKTPNGEVRVEASSSPDMTSLHSAEIQKLNLVAKSVLMGKKSLYDARNTMAIAERAARSGINFAKMLSYGNPEVKPEMIRGGITAADPDAIKNLFSRCVKSKGAMPVDPPCKGSTPGRVAWSESPGITMTSE